MLQARASSVPDVVKTSPAGAQAEPLVLPSEELWTGDLDGMQERHQIRFLVVYDRMFYFLDGATQRGGTFEMVGLFEKALNRKLGRKNLKVNALFIPVQRDELIPALLEGRGDVIAANLTVTESRLQKVDFTDPFLTGVKEVVVTGLNSPHLEVLEDLAGQTVHMRQTSSYYESLQRLNRRFIAEGRAPVQLVPVAPFMEDADLLEMVNASLIPLAVVDDHKARFWAELFPRLRVHEDIAVNTGGEMAWAIRKDSPKLKEVLNAFVAKHKVGTLHGNILYRRYLENNRWARSSLSEAALEKVASVMELFREYAEHYEFDWLMLAALAYQESALDQNKRSPEGAVGIMQVMPSTARDKNVAVKNIGKLEPNIHAGTKYLRFLYDRYFAKEPMTDRDRMLFSLASYNAGPAKIRRLRARAQRMGLDPNRWFGQVEVAAARLLGRETVQYVSNVYKYYTSYRLIADKLVLKAKAPALLAKSPVESIKIAPLVAECPPDGASENAPRPAACGPETRP